MMDGRLKYLHEAVRALAEYAHEGEYNCGFSLIESSDASGMTFSQNGSSGSSAMSVWLRFLPNGRVLMWDQELQYDEIEELSAKVSPTVGIDTLIAENMSEENSRVFNDVFTAVACLNLYMTNPENWAIASPDHA
jgi:hypothetical protein